MKIILKYILTNVKERKARTTVMLLSVVFSAMLLFVSFSIGVSYESAQRKMARGMAGNATISVQCMTEGIHTEDIPGLSMIQTMAGILETTSIYHENGYYETVDLLAVDIEALNQINKPRLHDGGEINTFSGYQIILPNRFTEKYGIKKGDSVILQIDNLPVSFQVSEIAAYDTVFLRQTRGTTALVPLETLREILGWDDSYHEILIEPEEQIITDSLICELQNALEHEKYRVSKIVNEEQIAADARQKSMPFFLICFFSLTMSIFIIYSSYKVITLDRLPIIGTFRSIGATQKSMTRILLLESLLYGGIGGILAIPIGIVVLQVILRGITKSLSQGIEIPVVISVPGCFLSFAVAVIVSVLSAWLPVRKASRLPIKDVVLGRVEEKHIPKPFIMGIGIALFMVSTVLPYLVTEKMLFLAGGISLLGSIVATILIIPIVTNMLGKGLEYVYYAIIGNEGKIAARNMKDNKNIIQNITLLFISISAVIAISVVGNFVTDYIGNVFRNAELQGFADGTMQPEFIHKVKEMEGIEQVLPVYVFENSIQAEGNIISRLEGTDNLELYNAMLALTYTDNDMQKRASNAFFEGKRVIVLNESIMKQIGCAIGDELRISNGSVESSYVVVGSFQSRATDVEAIIPATYARSDFGAINYQFLAYTAADPDAIMVQIRALFGETTNWSRTVEEFNNDALSTVGAFLRPMHSMTYFILILATVGIINNLLINYIQKQRITAMYKSIGLSNSQNMKMTLIEGFSSGFIGAIIAIVVSYMEIQTIFLVAAPKISMTPDLSLWTFLAWGASGMGITLLGSLVPIIKSRNTKLIEQLKFE